MSDEQQYPTAERPFEPFPTAHLWLNVRRPDEERDVANERVNQCRLEAVANILRTLDQLGWRQQFDAGNYADEGYVEWLCTKRVPSMRSVVLDLARVARIRRVGPGWDGFSLLVNDGQGNDELIYAIELDPPKPIDRCEACGSDRGDGYCQECPDDPDRPKEDDPVPCECEDDESPAISGVRWPSATNGDTSHSWVERCDMCETYADDEDAADALQQHYLLLGQPLVRGSAIAAGTSSFTPYLDRPEASA